MKTSEKRQHRWIDDSGEEFMVDSKGGYFIRERPSGFWAAVSETSDFEALADEILRLAGIAAQANR